MLKQLTLAAALLISAPAALAPAASASPQTEAFVANTAYEIQDKTGQSFAEALVAHVDVPRISRFVLGRHARGAAPADLAEFNQRFERFLVDALTEQSDQLEKARIRVLSSSDRNGRDSVVVTRVKVPGEASVNMRWRLMQRNGEWRIVDLEVFGLWLAIEQRAQIQAVLSQPGSHISDLYETFRLPEDRALNAISASFTP